MKHVRFALVGLTLLVAPVASAVPPPPPPPRQAATFDWSVAPGSVPGGEIRWFAKDYAVHFDASRWTEIAGARITSYAWTIQGPSAPPTHATAAFDVRLPEGVYLVTLKGTTASGASESVSKAVVVKNIVMVTLGDSFASGEGNPTRRYQYNPFVTQGVLWQDSQSIPPADRFSRCHRSTAAASSVAADSIEKEDPHTTVTFMSFACSGATLMAGVIGRYGGVEQPRGFEALPPQVDQLRDALKGSPNEVDWINVSIGGNDIRFSDIVTNLALKPNNPDLRKKLKGEFDANLATLYYDTTLAGLYAGNQAELAKHSPNTGWYVDFGRRLGQIDATKKAKIAATAYPNLFYQPGGYCPMVLGELAPLVGITAFQTDWAVRELLEPLNKTLARATSTLGWSFIASVQDDFNGHGYCGKDTTCSCNGGESWRRTAPDSTEFQGPVGLSNTSGRGHPDLMKDTKGMLHPNEAGHQAIAKRIKETADRTLFADLAIIGGQGPNATCDAGQMASFTFPFTYGSRGGGLAKDARIVVFLPTGARVVRHTLPFVPAATIEGSRAILKLPDVAEGASVQGSITIDVPCGQPGTSFQLPIAITAFSPDKQLDNNLAMMPAAFNRRAALPTGTKPELTPR
jgi:lysophospholipase L1-like esterase